MKKKFELKLRHILLLALLIIIIIPLLKSPSNDRNWNEDQQILSFSKQKGDIIHIYNIRNISYRNVKDFDVSHYNKSFNIEEIKSLDYVVEELEGFPGFAHTLLTFGFEDGSYIAASVEIRKEIGEKYHPLNGMVNEYELMIVLADEKDVINLRTNYRNDTVYLYPIKIDKKSLQKLFLDILNQTNSLKENPQFYNTFTSTCTTNLAQSASKTTQVSFFKYHPYILLPGYSDKLLLQKQLIKSNSSTIKEVRNEFNIKNKSKPYKHQGDFSYHIRS